MKKLFLITVLAVLAILLSTSVVGADKPPNVAAAFITDSAACGIWGDGMVVVYRGTYKMVFSNGATGQTLFRCHATLVPGEEPMFGFNTVPDSPAPGCVATISLEGEAAQWIAHCKGYSYPL